jgi:hypothetical protein
MIIAVIHMKPVQWEWQSHICLDWTNIVTFFASENQYNQWICYDFLHLQVNFIWDKLQSIPRRAGSHHLRSWVIEGSRDSLKWKEIDRRDGDNHLNGPSIVHPYGVHEGDQFYRYIHMRQIGHNHAGQRLLTLSGFELGAYFTNSPA